MNRDEFRETYRKYVHEAWGTHEMEHVARDLTGWARMIRFSPDAKMIAAVRAVYGDYVPYANALFAVESMAGCMEALAQRLLKGCEEAREASRQDA